VASFLRRGLLAGLIAGLAAGVFYLIVGEPVVQQAIGFQSATPGPHAAEVFSRGTQRIGLLAGTGLYGAAMGGVFGFLYALLEPRLKATSPWQRSLGLAAVAFASAWLVPFLKYPSNPPGVGEESTVGQRTRLYLAMVALSIATSVGAWLLARYLERRGVPPAPRQLMVGAGYLAVILGLYALLPPFTDEISLPGGVLWNARRASAGGQALLWLVLGAGFGWLSVWAETARRPRRSATGSAGASRGLRSGG
jgi:Probable cobalt transporter subunit (CbtA)